MSRIVKLPVSRATCLGRATLRLGCGLVMCLPLAGSWTHLRFVPSAISNRITDFAIAWIFGLLLLGGVCLMWRAVRWLRLACTSGQTGFQFDDAGITARLGPFGYWNLNWADLTVDWPDYLFEIELDPNVPLPMRECPPIAGRDGAIAVDRQLRLFCSISEDQWWPRLEACVRPLLFDDPRLTPDQRHTASSETLY